MGSWCSRGPRHKEHRKCLAVAVPQRLMGTVKRGPVPSPWAGSEAEFYSVPQSFPVELDPSHPLRWPGLTGCLYPLCHLPARLPVPCALPSTAHTLGPLPRTWAQTPSISLLCHPVPPPAGHLALRRGTSAGISTPWLTEKRSERGGTPRGAISYA